MIRRVLALVAAAGGLAAHAQAVPAFTDITPPGGISRLGVHPLEPERLVAVSDSGVHVSRDAGGTWSAVRGVYGAERLFVHRGQPGVVFVQQPGRAHTFSFGPTSWSGGATWRSTDFGETWVAVRGELSGAQRESISPFASDPLDPKHLFAASRGPTSTHSGGSFPNPSSDRSVLESFDDGLTWQAAAAGLPANAWQWGMDGVHGPTPGAPARLFFVVDGLGAFVSEDGARSWKPFTTGIARIGWVKQDPLRANVLYAWGNRDAAGRSQVLRSADGGGTWEAVFAIHNSADYGSLRSPLLVVDPAKTGRLWLGGLEAGVFLSEDEGRSWRGVGFDDWRFASDIVPSPSDSSQVYVLVQGKLFRGDMAPRPRVVVEYRYGERFWLAKDPAEAIFQDHRAGDAVRSGEGFGLWSALDAPPGAVAVCRFQGNPASGQSSRFITLAGAECEALKRGADWILEGEGELFAMPPGPGGCDASHVPVTRFFNGERVGNHRYVAAARAVGEMRARGWIEEGVAFCARPPGENR